MDNLCYEKDLKVRISELKRYRESSLMKVDHLVPYEKLRYINFKILKNILKKIINTIGLFLFEEEVPMSMTFFLIFFCLSIYNFVITF